MRRLVLRQSNRVIQQTLVGNHFATARTGVSRDNQCWLRIIDTGRQTVRGKAAKHYRMYCADASTSQHRKYRFGNHRHIDQDPITLADTVRLHDRGHAIDFRMQLAERVSFFGPGFGRDGNQCGLCCACRQVAIDRVMTQIGLTVDKPAREWRPGIIKCFGERLMPVDTLRLVSPEGIRVVYRLPVKGVEIHVVSSC